MAGNKRPSFLKSQKEQKRKAKAQEKRAARAERRARANEPKGPDEPVLEGDVQESEAEAGNEEPGPTS